MIQDKMCTIVSYEQEKIKSHESEVKNRLVQDVEDKSRIS